MTSGDPTSSEYLPKNGEERGRLIGEADFAFKQAFAVCPYSPEAVYRYVNFLMSQSRPADALLVAEAALHLEPQNNPPAGLVTQLKALRRAR